MAQNGLSNIPKARLDDLCRNLENFLISQACNFVLQKRVRREIGKLETLLSRQSRGKRISSNPIICISNSFFKNLLNLELLVREEEENFQKKNSLISRKQAGNSEMENLARSSTAGNFPQMGYILNEQI
jgi:hypothetical protein